MRTPAENIWLMSTTTVNQKVFFCTECGYEMTLTFFVTLYPKDLTIPKDKLLKVSPEVIIWDQPYIKHYYNNHI